MSVNLSFTSPTSFININTIHPSQDRDKESIDLNDFHSACTIGDFENVKRMIQAAKERSIDIVNTKNEKELSPLHLACRYGHLKVVQFLVESGAKLDEKNGPLESTALHIASFGGYTEIVEMLSEKDRATVN